VYVSYISVQGCIKIKLNSLPVVNGYRYFGINGVLQVCTHFPLPWCITTAFSLLPNVILLQYPLPRYSQLQSCRVMGNAWCWSSAGWWVILPSYDYWQVLPGQTCTGQRTWTA